MPWALACPSCRTPLAPTSSGERWCPRCEVGYRSTAGVWRLLAAGREEFIREFVQQYETVRSSEGRRVEGPNHLRALPFRDLSRKRPHEWAIRARSFETLLRCVVKPFELASGKRLRILDLGSGLGWLAYRLARRGHQVAAVDIVLNDFDGLGVHRHYDELFVSVQAEFDHLPFGDQSVDLAIYNASFHYAFDYVSTLREALRVLAAGGRAVIMDTPIYRDPSSGAAMVREREEAFEAKFGFRGDTPRREGFLTYDKLNRLADNLALEWQLIEPWYGLRWWLKPLFARFRRLREPARFKLVVGCRAGER
jgi:SAM-dependent methyltransferase